VPSAQHPDDVVVDVAAQECHGTTSSERFCATVAVMEARLVCGGNIGMVKGLCDIFCLDRDAAGSTEVRGDGRGGDGGVGAKMDDAAGGCADEAGPKVGAEAVGEYLTLVSILLRGESE
jgi:hypothetical protein